MPRRTPRSALLLISLGAGYVVCWWLARTMPSIREHVEAMGLIAAVSLFAVLLIALAVERW